MKKIKVLIVDDSSLVRQLLSRGLAADPEIEVVATANDPYVARDKIIKFQPDVMTLDVEMPRMDGIEFLRKLMPQFPIPVLIVSSLSERGCRITLDALEAGAVDFVTKPSTDLSKNLNAMMAELREKVKISSRVSVRHWKGKKLISSHSASPVQHTDALAVSTDKVIAIGASTGGTEAIREVICGLPSNMPGIVIVQHMPPGFTKKFAERINNIAAMDVREAQGGERILQGHVLLAPGDKHMKVVRQGGIYKVHCEEGEKVCRHCPSVEVLFDSVSRYVGNNAIGVMLTGMGRDGADAMLSMRNAGAKTIAQDEATSVVFGMPGEAWECGGAERLIPLGDISKELIRMVGS